MPDIGPFNINNLLAGACRVLRAPTTVAVPTDLSSIIALTGAAAPAAGWIDIGGTGDSSSYERELESEDYEIENRSGVVLSEITSTQRTFSTTFAEITPEHLQIVEEAPVIATVAAVASSAGVTSKSAQKIVRGGSIDELSRHRIAFIARRKKSQALVTEPGGATRGAAVAGVLLNTSLTADSVDLEFAKGSLTGVEVSFQAFPDPAGAAGSDGVMWIFEQPGVMT